MAMLNAEPKIHLEIQTSRKTPVGILRTTFWDREQKKYKHKQIARIKNKTLNELRLIQASFRGDVVPVDSPEATQNIQSRELGASQEILNLIKRLELHKIIYSRNEPWVQCILAMVTGRIIYQDSKLALCNVWENTCLWELCGVEEKPQVQKHCYSPMDELLKRKPFIQKKLADKHLKKNEAETLILYDITSTYFEGEYEDSELVTYGYNRDKKRGTKQVVIGLICTAEGCPIAIEIFKGNTKDDLTVIGKITEIRELYGIRKCTFVGDRGMLTAKNLDHFKNDAGLFTITALTHGNMKGLLESKTIQLELFDEKNIVEVNDLETPEIRYCLCKNPQSAAKETATRKRLLELSENALQEIADYKRKCTVEVLGSRVGRILQKYKMGKFIDWHVEASTEGESQSDAHKLIWKLNEEKISQEQQLDGCYIIRTDLPEGTMNTGEVVASYKDLGNIERAFRNMKTVTLEMRPVHHKTDARIESHLFICMLAYYVQWHMHKAFEPIYEADGQGAERSVTFRNLVEKLKSIRSNTMRTNKIEYECPTHPDEKQQQIIDLLEQIA
jgi:transposase